MVVPFVAISQFITKSVAADWFMTEVSLLLARDWQVASERQLREKLAVTVDSWTAALTKRTPDDRSKLMRQPSFDEQIPEMTGGAMTAAAYFSNFSSDNRFPLSLKKADEGNGQLNCEATSGPTHFPKPS